MRATTPTLTLLFLFGLFLHLPSAGGQSPSEPLAPKPSAAVQTLLDAANKSLQVDKPEETLKATEQALETAKAAQDIVGQASALRAKAQSLTRLNRIEDSIVAWKEAAAAWERAGDGPGQVEALGQAGVLLMARKPEEAKGLLERALTLGKAEMKRPLASADELNNVGNILYNSDKLVEARSFIEAALAIREKLAPNSLDVAHSLNNLGYVAKSRGDFAAAEDYFKRALTIKEKLAPNSLDVASSLNSLGNLADDQNDFAAAEDYFKRSLAIREKLTPNSLDVAISFNHLGAVAYERGDLAVAEDYFKHALAVRDKLAPNSLDVAESLHNLGTVADDQNDFVVAVDYFKRALAIWKKLAPNSLDVADSLNNVGAVDWHQGDLAAAEDYFKRALVIREKLAPNSLDVAHSLNNLGNVADDQGDFAAAEDYFKRALTIKEKLAPNSLTVATSLNNVGTVDWDQGDLAAAEDYFKRALVIREKLAPNSLDVASNLNNLGSVAEDRNDFAAAEDYLKRALTIKEKLAPNSLTMAASLNNLGSVADDRGDLAAAEEYHKRALTIREKLAPNSLDVAESLHNLGDIAKKQNDLPGAIRMAQQAWNLVRQQAQSVSGDEARQAFGEAYTQYAANLLEYEVTLKKPEAIQSAFLTLEQGRAQALQQLLSKRRLLAEKQNSPLRNTYELAVHKRDEALTASSEAAIAQKRAETAVSATKEPGARTTSAETARLQVALKQADVEFQKAQSAYTQARVHAEDAWKQVKAANPRAFVQERSLAELQHSLSSGTLFVAFSVGSQQSHLFLLRSNGSVEAFVLPLKAKDLQQQIKSLRDDLTDPQSDPARLSATSHRLFAALFPPPVRKEIAAASRLLLSPDGPLWNLPFAALVSNLSSASTATKTSPSSPTYLGETKPITYTQSLSLFAQARQEKPSLTHGQKPVALVLGDPIFVHSPPVLVASVIPSSRTAASDRTLHGERGFLWDKSAPPQRLEQTRNEALKIAKLYDTTPLLGKHATETQLRQHIEQADILHLATHGYFHPKVAMASGILLTPPAVEPPVGETNNDGALQAWEIFSQLHLRAELVVLSACETGLGKNVAGEGVIGLTRALQYAGCRSIVTSQWQVNDASTAILMTALHRNLRAGMAKDEALRTAMASVRGNGKTSHPYYWAAFFLTGDPDNVNLGTRAAPTKQAKK